MYCIFVYRAAPSSSGVGPHVTNLDTPASGNVVPSVPLGAGETWRVDVELLLRVGGKYVPRVSGKYVLRVGGKYVLRVGGKYLLRVGGNVVPSVPPGGGEM